MMAPGSAPDDGKHSAAAVGDFGLAKRGPLQESDDTLTAALTGKGEILGTLQYISAEQLHGKEADTRSDLFSFSRKRQNRSLSAAP
jgi:hypothetical protein